MAVPEEVRAAPALVFVAHLDQPELSPEDSHHLVDVLRLRDGTSIVASDGTGGFRLCTLAAAARTGRRKGSQVRVEAVGEIRRAPAPERPIAVGLALAKGDRPEWAVQKLTELGVDQIVLLDTARSVVRPPADARGQRRIRLLRVSREAAMQARRLRLPSISGPTTLQEALVALPGPVALAHPGAPPLGGAVSSVLVGPEGGFTPEELALTDLHAGLPGFLLRTETAAVTAAALLAAFRSRASTSTRNPQNEPLSPRSVVK